MKRLTLAPTASVRVPVWFSLLVIVTILSTGLAAPGALAAPQAPMAGSAVQFDGTNDYVTFGIANGPTGTATNGPTWSTSPQLGGAALEFDGTNDYVTFGAAPNLVAAVFTLETWFYWTGGGATITTGTGGLTAAIPLVTKGRGEAEGSNVDMNYFLGIQGGKLAADFEEGAGGPGPLGQNHPVVGNTTVTSNAWHHAAVTYDGRIWKLYLDGNLDQTLDLGATVPPRSDSIQHAALASALTSAGTAAGYFSGRLDEARGWNVVRSQADIQAAMNQEVPSGVGLLGRWGMNEGSGTIVVGSPGLGVPRFTLETWFKWTGGGVTTYTGTGGVVAIPLITKGMAESDNAIVDMNYFLGIRASDSVLVADFEEGAGQASPGLNHPVAGVTPITPNVWHHAAATYDGNNWKLYLDGVQDGSLALTGNRLPRFDSTQHAALASALQSSGNPGSSSGYGPGYFAGVLDEARIWNYARTQAEIQSTKDVEVTSAVGLIGRWAMNEGAGTTVADLRQWLHRHADQRADLGCQLYPSGRDSPCRADSAWQRLRAMRK